MSGTAISQLPAAVAINNTDIVPVVEIGTPNVTKRLTVAQLLANTMTAAGGVFTGPVEFQQGLVVDNAQWLQWKNSTGTPQNVMEVDAGNNTIIRTGNGLDIQNAAGAVNLAQVDGSGNLTVPGIVTASSFNTTGTASTSVYNLSVNGTLTTNTISAAGSLAVNGNTTVNGTTVFNGNGTFDNYLTVGSGIFCGGAGIQYGVHWIKFDYNGSTGRLDVWSDNTLLGGISLGPALAAIDPVVAALEARIAALEARLAA